MTTKIKTPVEVRVRNLESSPTFESKIERLINREKIESYKSKEDRTKES